MKPKCPNITDLQTKELCGKAMKRPYQRNGAQGALQSLQDWWYCPSCNYMMKQPYISPIDPERYYDARGAKKFPIISRAQEEKSPLYVSVIDELEETNKRSQEKRFVPHPSILSKALVEYISVWHCKYCGFEEDVDDTIIFPEEELSEQPVPPSHCNFPMKILLRMGNTFDEHKLEPIDAIIRYLKEGKGEEAGMEFLNMIIDYLQGKKRPLKITSESASKIKSSEIGFSVDKYNRDLRIGIVKDLTELSKTDNYYKKTLHNSWGYKTGVQMLQAFIDIPSLLSVKSLSRMNLKVSFPDVNVYDSINILTTRGLLRNSTTLQRLIAVFDDIVLYLSNKFPSKIPDYRIKQNAIIENLTRN